MEHETRAMRLLLPALSVCAILAGSACAAQAGGSLFGSPDRVPSNPFASNYPSAPPRADSAYERAPRRATPRRTVRPRPGEPLRPPRDIPG